MRVLVAMSGGVDSSVAAALLREAGHDVVGCTLRLWGGAAGEGCCAASDVDDARRVAQQLGIDHYVFGFADDFTRHVVGPYLDEHAAGRTPNPCVECNRHLKFDRLLRRTIELGFDALATGHHARVELDRPTGRWRLRRGADAAKDQSYVLHMLGQQQLSRVLLPVGDRTKATVRDTAHRLGLRTAGKPDSQEVCFVAAGGRGDLVRAHRGLTPGVVVDAHGRVLGEVPAVELVTVGQRRGLGGGGDEPRYAVAVDVAGARVTVGTAADLLVDAVTLGGLTWVDGPARGPVVAQCSAHGRPRPATVDGSVVHFDAPERRVAPGQSVVLYDGEHVLGGGIAT